MDATESIQAASNAESTVLAALTSESATLAELKQRIKGKVRLKPPQLKALLDGLLAQHKIHQRPRPGNGAKKKTIEFAVGAPPPPPPPPPLPRDIAPPEILAILQGGPLTPSELKKRVKQAVPGLKDPDLTSIMADLVSAKKVYARRKSGKNGVPTKTLQAYVLFGPGAFIAPVMACWAQARTEARAEGVADEALVASLLAALASAGCSVTAGVTEPISDDRAEVLRGVRALEAREGRGALIPIRKLRESLRLNKPRLDAALLGLFADDAVILHHHDYVGSLSDAERNELVLDRHGNHYIGVALRGES
jgi:hypothetical protein